MKAENKKTVMTIALSMVGALLAILVNSALSLETKIPKVG